MKTYVIYDWAGNRKFQGETFATIEDAYSRIAEYLAGYAQLLSDEELDESLGEYCVTEDET